MLSAGGRAAARTAPALAAAPAAAPSLAVPPLDASMDSIGSESGEWSEGEGEDEDEEDNEHLMNVAKYLDDRARY